MEGAKFKGGELVQYKMVENPPYPYPSDKGIYKDGTMAIITQCCSWRYLLDTYPAVYYHPDLKWYYEEGGCWVNIAGNRNVHWWFASKLWHLVRPQDDPVKIMAYVKENTVRQLVEGDLL